MDHNEALRRHAVEKYVLGELPPSLRDEFEEHLFECQECAQDVKAAAEFVETSGRFCASPLDNFLEPGGSPRGPGISGHP